MPLKLFALIPDAGLSEGGHYTSARQTPRLFISTLLTPRIFLYLHNSFYLFLGKRVRFVRPRLERLEVRLNRYLIAIAFFGVLILSALLDVRVLADPLRTGVNSIVRSSAFWRGYHGSVSRR